MKSYILNGIRQITPPVIYKYFRNIYRQLRPLPVTSERLRDAEAIRLHTLGSDGTAEVNFFFDRGVKTNNARAFINAYKNYFVKECYRFVCRNKKPFIIDCGANIGLTVRYWKQLFPDSEIVAIESDPEIFVLLRSNVDDLSNIHLINKAVWINNDEISFAAIGSEGGHIDSLCSRGMDVPKVVVPCFRLRDLLCRQVDLLKIDIEGAEIDVLRDCFDRLHFVDRIIVEYHSFEDRPQRAGEFFSLLEEAGFRVCTRQPNMAQQPFVKPYSFNQKDWNLDVFAFRPGSVLTSSFNPDSSGVTD